MFLDKLFLQIIFLFWKKIQIINSINVLLKMKTILNYK